MQRASKRIIKKIFAGREFVIFYFGFAVLLYCLIISPSTEQILLKLIKIHHKNKRNFKKNFVNLFFLLKAQLHIDLKMNFERNKIEIVQYVELVRYEEQYF